MCAPLFTRRQSTRLIGGIGGESEVGALPRDKSLGYCLTPLWGSWGRLSFGAPLGLSFGALLWGSWGRLSFGALLWGSFGAFGGFGTSPSGSRMRHKKARRRASWVRGRLTTGVQNMREMCVSECVTCGRIAAAGQKRPRPPPIGGPMGRIGMPPGPRMSGGP